MSSIIEVETNTEISLEPRGILPRGPTSEEAETQRTGSLNPPLIHTNHIHRDENNEVQKETSV